MHLSLDATASFITSLVSATRQLAFPDAASGLFAFTHRAEASTSAGDFGLDGWAIYHPRREFERQGCRLGADAPRWALHEQDATYSLSPTYPREFVVPATLNVGDLAQVARYRSRQRVPALTWLCAPTGAALCRSSQPRAGVSGRRSEPDELILDLYRRHGGSAEDPPPPVAAPTARENASARGSATASPFTAQQQEPAFVASTEARRIHILDCRAKINAQANQLLQGKGAELLSNYTNATLTYGNIANIHSMRESLAAVTELVNGSGHSDEGAHWYRRLDETGWLDHLALVLQASVTVASLLLDGVSVLVHCSDGWDRTAQVWGYLYVRVHVHVHTHTHCTCTCTARACECACVCTCTCACACARRWRVLCLRVYVLHANQTLWQ